MTDLVELTKEITKQEILECGPLRARFNDIFEAIDNPSIAIEDKTEEELQLMVAYDMGMALTEFEVNPGETRQAHQYNPNNYNSRMTFDCTVMYDALMARVASAAAGKKLAAYVKGKAALFKIIENRYAAYERFQRGLMRTEQKHDGIAPIPNK